MSTSPGVWEPKRAISIDLPRLESYVALMAAADPAHLAAALTEEQLAQGSLLMKQPLDAWQIATALDVADLVTLVRFFTLAEMQLVGWDGGQTSPVIPLVKILKARNAFTPELRKWIKSNTDNRFLPYGSVL